MTKQILTSNLQPMDHEFRTYKNEVEKFYDAIKADDIAMQDSLLHTIDQKGLADIFARDYEFACRVNAEPSYTRCIWISYLYQDLPSPNRAWTEEETILVKKLVISASKGLCPASLINKTLNREYRDMLQTIKGAKYMLIDLNKVPPAA